LLLVAAAAAVATANIDTRARPLAHWTAFMLFSWVQCKRGALGEN
jgi:hypothetical protein